MGYLYVNDDKTGFLDNILIHHGIKEDIMYRLYVINIFMIFELDFSIISIYII